MDVFFGDFNNDHIRLLLADPGEIPGGQVGKMRNVRDLAEMVIQPGDDGIQKGIIIDHRTRQVLFLIPGKCNPTPIIQLEVMNGGS